MLNVVYFRRYIRSVWRVAIYLDGVLEMSNYYEFLKAPEDEISVSWPGETKSYKLSDIKSLESEIARLKRANEKLKEISDAAAEFRREAESPAQDLNLRALRRKILYKKLDAILEGEGK